MNLLLIHAVPLDPLNPGGQVQSGSWFLTVHSAVFSHGFSMAQGSWHILLMHFFSGGQSEFALHSTLLQLMYGSPSNPTGQVHIGLWPIPVHSALPPHGRSLGPQTGVHSPFLQACVC